MKRILTILLALVIGLSMSAQIQRSFLGFTLGKTTTSEVHNKYKNESNFSIKKNGDCGLSYNIDFAGYSWEHVSFEFYKGKLYRITFFTSQSLYSDYSKFWNKLKSSLNRKYSQYYLKSSTNDSIQYSDYNTSITLKYYIATAAYREVFYHLIYTDCSLSNQKAIDEENEL